MKKSMVTKMSKRTLWTWVFAVESPPHGKAGPEDLVADSTLTSDCPLTHLGLPPWRLG